MSGEKPKDVPDCLYVVSGPAPGRYELIRAAWDFIAAAPDLLSALREIEALVEGYVDGTPDAPPIARLANRVSTLARAAIERAEGRTP